MSPPGRPKGVSPKRRSAKGSPVTEPTLVLNCGSLCIKFAVFDASIETP